MRAINLIVGLAILTNCSSAYAISDFRDAWRTIYPNSNSDDIGPEILSDNDKGCQLCHRDDDGGDPWNAYGWTVRQFYLDGAASSIELAIQDAEDLNQDNDPSGATSKDEINNNFQPGWTLGNTNTIYFANNSTQSNQPPPFVPATTGIDFPNAISNPLPMIAMGNVNIELHEVAGGFNAPLQAVRAPGIDGSLFIVEQGGKIFRLDLSSGEKSLFKDVGADIVTLGGGNDERGLLGLAFHPNYQSNGLFYTYQSEPKRASQDDQVDFSTVLPNSNFNHRSMVVAYRASNPSCNSYSAKLANLLVINQPQSNHNGGDLAFGPDGYLYISLGDGGGASDRGFGHGSHGNGRDNTNPLGSILRIDPLGGNSQNGRYGIPVDNPFVGNADPGVDEIFAYGFRNPFRISFDAMAGSLYAGDVGQGEVEEVNIVTSGGNYGWNWKEGDFFFYDSQSSGRFISDVPPPGLPSNLIDPEAQYGHEGGSLQSVIGGYVYRGADIPALSGRYVFGDFIKRLFYLDLDNNVKEFLGAGTSDFVTAFGQDSENELYVVTRVQSGTSGTNGKLLKIMQPGASYQAPSSNGESASCPPSEELCVPIKTASGAVTVICL